MSNNNNNRLKTIDRITFRIPLEFQPLFNEFAKKHGIKAQNQWLLKFADFIMEKNEHQDPINPESNIKNETFTTGTEQPKRSFLKASAEETAYMKQKAIQKAKREGALERMKDREEFRKKAMGDRYEREHLEWEQRQKQREATSHRVPKVFYPDQGGAVIVADQPRRKKWD